MIDSWGLFLIEWQLLNQWSASGRRTSFLFNLANLEGLSHSKLILEKLKTFKLLAGATLPEVLAAAPLIISLWVLCHHRPTRFLPPHRPPSPSGRSAWTPGKPAPPLPRCRQRASSTSSPEWMELLLLAVTLSPDRSTSWLRTRICCCVRTRAQEQ